eukprot:2516317-Rhodomonas_salina.1
MQLRTASALNIQKADKRGGTHCSVLRLHAWYQAPELVRFKPPPKFVTEIAYPATRWRRRGAKWRPRGHSTRPNQMRVSALVMEVSVQAGALPFEFAPFAPCTNTANNLKVRAQTGAENAGSRL